MKMNFYFHGNKTHFHKKGLVLKVTVILNQKWPIILYFRGIPRER